MITLYRFSEDGFIAKKQEHHLRILKEFQNPPDLTGLNFFQRERISKTYEESLPLLAKLNLADWEKGVFVFVGDMPTSSEMGVELNHLKIDDLVKRQWHELEIAGSTEVYTVYGLIPILFTAWDFIVQYGKGSPAFIPERSLNDYLPRQTT